jgi:hypothetical protein
MKIYEHMNDVLDIMWGNLMEAEKYIKQAHELHDECRLYADWCHAMATKHIEFNTDGKAVYDRLKERMHEDHEHAEHHAGIVMILDRNMAKLTRHCSEIKAMMAMYK